MIEVIYKILLGHSGRVYYTRNQEFAMYWRRWHPFDAVTPCTFVFVNSEEELESKETEHRKKEALDKLTEDDKILLGLK